MEIKTIKDKHELSDSDRAYLEKYVRYMLDIPEVETEEERKLLERSIDSDEESQARLVEIYIKKTIHVALAEINKGASLKQLVEYGNIGVILGVEKILDVDTAHITIMNNMKQYMKLCL